MSNSTAAVWARVSHDLRQPIQSMQLLTHIMTLADDPDQRRKAARSMEASLDALQAMLDDLALLGKLEAGLEPYTPSTLALADMLRQVARQQEARAAEHGLAIVTRLVPVTIAADRRLLPRLMGGLLSNALKFSRGKEIVLRCRPGNGGADVEIEFEGPPLSDSICAANFIELRQGTGLDAVSQTSAGLGVLSLMAGLQGAEIRVESLTDSKQQIALFIPEREAAA